MGVDVNLYAEVVPNEERLAQAEEFFTARCGIGDPWPEESGTVLSVAAHEWLSWPRVEVSTFARYYGPGYERGDWPTIYGAIRTLQAAFPNSRVFYGGDGDDCGVECTDEHLAEIWAHFLGPSGDGYRRRARELNARNSPAPDSPSASGTPAEVDGQSSGPKPISGGSVGGASDA